MKKLFTNLLGLALSVMVLASCSQMATYEQADVTPEEVAAAAKDGFNLTPFGTGGNENAIVLDCNNSCITDTSADQFAVTTTSAPVTWGGQNQNNNSKMLSVKVWNTLTTIEYRFTLISNLGSIPGSNLQYFDEATQLWVNIGDLVPGVVKVVSRPLPAAWTKCQVITEQWKQTGGGAPVELGNVSYSLIGICTTTTIAKDSETSVCVENGTINLTGTVTSFGTFTGGNIKIQQFNGVSYVDVASEAVGDGILVYAFDPSAAGTYTFRAAYDGTGSNGYNNSVSSDITVEAIVCAPTCEFDGNEFSGEAISCGTSREANFVFGSEDGIGYFKMQGGLTNFTGADAVVTIFDGLVDVTNSYSVSQRTPGGSSNRVITVEGTSLAECGSIRVNITWGSSNSGGVITGDWSVKDAGGVEYAPEVLGLTCPLPL